tara:strand:+ start:63 stop:260 length:198 start_codon:yes stop_codon:yes gene_type:complete
MDIYDEEQEAIKENYLLRMNIANIALSKMKPREQREFIVSHLMWEYKDDPSFLASDIKHYIKEEV